MKILNWKLIPKAESKVWQRALRSGKFKQGSPVLYNSNCDSYCCLGVACKVFYRGVKEEDLKDHGFPMNVRRIRSVFGANYKDSFLSISNDDSMLYMLARLNDGCKLTDNQYFTLLKHVSEDSYLRDKIERNFGTPINCIVERWNFNEIADLIEYLTEK